MTTTNNMPGFTAETSVYKTNGRYRLTTRSVGRADAHIGLAQVFRPRPDDGGLRANCSSTDGQANRSCGGDCVAGAQTCMCFAAPQPTPGAGPVARPILVRA